MENLTDHEAPSALYDARAHVSESQPEEPDAAADPKPDQQTIPETLDIAAESPATGSDAQEELTEIKEEDPRFDPLEQTAKAVVDFAVQGLVGLTHSEAHDAKVAWLKAQESARPDELVHATRNLIHEHSLGKPAYFIVRGAVGSEEGARLVADFVACYELPIDSTLLQLRRGVQVLGAIAAIINGQPVLAIAALESLLADEATRHAKRLIVQIITTPFHSEATTTTTSAPGPTIEELVELAKAFGWTHLVPGCAW